MRRIAAVFAFALFVAAQAIGGVTYDFRQVTTGAQETTIAGSVLSDGAHLRMDVDRGDGLVFKDGSIIISRDGGKTLLVFHPPSKTYFELPMEALARLGSDTLNNGLVKVTFDAPKLAVHDEGDGGMVEGYPTRRMSVDGVINITVDAMGQKLGSSLVMHSDNWSTDKIDPSIRNLFQMSNPRIGIEALDKLIAAQSSAFIGRFPLKQVSTLRLKQNGQESVTTSTTTVTNLRTKSVDAAAFTDPAGYRKVDNPIDALLKRRR